jgi:DNA-binding protein YbaB
MRSRVEAMSAQLAALTATARSMDRSVTATVGPQGELLRLTIDPALAARLDLTTLAARILEAAALAAAHARERLGSTMGEALPDHLRHMVGPDGTVDVRGLLAPAAGPDDRLASFAAVRARRGEA